MLKRYLHGPTTWKVMQSNAWKDSANLRIKQLSNFSKSQRHAWINHQFKEEDNGIIWRIVYCLLTYCSGMFIFWHVLGGLIFFGV